MQQWLGFIISLLLIAMWPANVSAARDEVVFTVAASPSATLVSRYAIQETGRLAEQLLSAPSVPGSGPDLPRAVIQSGKRSFVLDANGVLYEQKSGRKLLLPDHVQAELERYVRRVEEVHFGKPLDWREVKKAFRRMGYAEVIDVETGKRFRVQRRAGSKHADVQPVTKADSRIMKEIYQGRWSWKRRAILLSIDGTQYAASMHGMPHGAGGIYGNNFHGHFCIHFRGSTTHGSGKTDPSHQLMVAKAAGQLPALLMKADPYQLIDLYLVALHEQDRSLLSLLSTGNKLDAPPVPIAAVKRGAPFPEEVPGGLAMVVPVQVRYVPPQGKEEKAEWIFLLRRASELDRWKVDTVTPSLPKEAIPDADVPHS